MEGYMTDIKRPEEREAAQETERIQETTASNEEVSAVNKGGRPVLHGLKVITGNRIRKARLEIANGSSRRRIASDIFNLSPKTLRRLMAEDHPRSLALKRAIQHGELLRHEPLASLICMLIDERDQLIYETEGDQTCERRILEEKINLVMIMNDDLKRYLKRDGRKKDHLDDHFNEDNDPISLNEIAKELNLRPLETLKYTYKEHAKP